MALFFLYLFAVHQDYGLLEGYFQRVDVLGDGHIGAVVSHVGAVFACAYCHGLALIFSQLVRQLQQFECLLQGDGLHGLALLELCKAGFHVVVGLAHLYYGTKAAYLH